MTNSNPLVPRIYGLPKIHKPGNKMRFIVSNIGSPSHNLAKFLVKQFAALKPMDDFSIKNAYELIDSLKNVEICDDETLISFDITSFYPSVPIDDALTALENWLARQSLSPLERLAYYEMTAVCMKQNYFQFRKKFYHQKTGTAMGNPLSPFMCNLFMVEIEKNLSENNLFPKIWKRYVDDVFAIVKKSNIEDILNLINNANPNIKFTHELEKDGRICFLDLSITREEDKKLTFDIYRKPTSTDRFITSDSYHHSAHKHAAFNSMIHRLVNVPLNEERYNEEWKHILKVADMNGYNNNLMHILLKRHQRKRLRNESTSFVLEESDKKRIAVQFHAPLFPHLNKASNSLPVRFVPTSKKLKLKTMLGSTKDKVEDMEKSGVYLFKCPHENCEAAYIGETSRSLNIRAGEHINSMNKNRPELSAIAEHAMEMDHIHIQKSDFCLLSNITQKTRLRVCESMHIKTHPNLINRDDGVITDSCLFTLLQSKVNHGSTHDVT